MRQFHLCSSMGVNVTEKMLKNDDNISIGDQSSTAIHSQSIMLISFGLFI